MKTLSDAELMDTQFDHWEKLDNNSVIQFRLTQDKSEYYPPQYLTPKGEVKHLELRIDSPATLHVFAQGQPGAHIEICVLENEEYKILDQIHEFGQIHKTDIKAQHNTVFLYFKMKTTGTGAAKIIDVKISLSYNALKRKTEG